MQVKYPSKRTPTHWDPVHLTYPVRKFPETGQSSETIARRFRGEPEVLKHLKTECYEVKHYDVDHTIRSDLVRSQTTVDYSHKVSETKILNKHTSCVSNNYLYPPQKNLSDRVPNLRAHGVSETRDKYRSHVLDSRLVTDKDQFKTHHSSDPCEPIFSKEIEPLFFSYDGFEKYLDPYVTTSRLHHSLFTAEQTHRTNNRDVVTYYTWSNTPWVRSRKPCTPFSGAKRGAKSIYDREKFKNEFREIRTHNKLNWVPNAFRTEVRDNFAPKPGQLESKVHSGEEQVKAFHSRTMASLKTKELEEDLSMKRMYITENAVVGSRKPLCNVFDPYVERNKRLAHKTK